MDVERPQRVAIVRGHEQDRRQVRRRDRLHDLEPVALRHLDVEEHQVGTLARDERQRRLSVAALADDGDAGLGGEQAADAAARRRLVVDDQRRASIRLRSR